MRPQGFVQDYAGGQDLRKIVTTDATGSYEYTLKPYERKVEVTSTLGVGTIRMPPVAECEGLAFDINALTGNSNAVTVADYASNHSYDWPGDLTLNAALDRALLFSDGRKWWVLTDMFT